MNTWGRARRSGEDGPRRLTGMGLVGAAILTVSLSACIAPDVERIGALGVTVDEEARPIIVVEACDGAADSVDLFLDREGLSDDEENESVGSWTVSAPAAGTSELALHSPQAPWQGVAVEVTADRGYIATGGGEGEDEVLSQVAFSGADLAELDPGMVYSNDDDPDATNLIARTPADFTADMCSRG